MNSHPPPSIHEHHFSFHGCQIHEIGADIAHKNSSLTHARRAEMKNIKEELFKKN